MGFFSDSITLSLMEEFSNNLLEPTKEAMDFFNRNVNRLVKIKGTGYKGIIVALNTRTDTSQLPGEFPIIVRITESKSKHFQHVVGCEFEYPLSYILLEQ